MRAFDRIADGLREAVAIARGERKPARVFVPIHQAVGTNMSYELPRYITAKFPALTAALVQIAKLSEGDELDAARREAIEAYANEMLPAILGGDWESGPSWPELIPIELSAHALWFQRHDDPPSWDNYAVISHPPQSTVDDGGVVREVRAAGRLLPSFLAAVEPLLQLGIGVWVSNDLSYWHPGRTVCVLMARGLAPERAPAFGFRPIRG